jgi:hypothetical protein
MIGWIFIGLNLFNIGVNWLALLYKVLSTLKDAIMKAYLNWKAKKAL